MPGKNSTINELTISPNSVGSKRLEENGVGRPSTYAPTIETIQKRYYVKLVSKRFEPTELGEIVNSLIVEFFPGIVNVKFTAEMEAKTG